MDRRDLLRFGLAASFAGRAKPARAEPPDDTKLLEIARRLIVENADRILERDVAAIVDFGAPSWRPRFHLADIENGRISSFLVAHGRGSDPDHTGWLQTFSNEKGSNATSCGAYRTGAGYVGKYGRAMRLVGLDPDNSNAEARAIVIHAAWYVGDQMLTTYGKLGRSEGCFALSNAGLAAVFESLGANRLLLAATF